MKNLFKYILALVLVSTFLTSFSRAHAKNDPTSKTFNVSVKTIKGERIFTVRAPKDYIALDSVAVGGVYRKALGKFIEATVLETNLSTRDLPARDFYVATDKKEYHLYLNSLNPDYVLLAIQASRHLMSKASTREASYLGGKTRLKEKPPVKYTIKFKSFQKSVLLNTHDAELGRIALEIAARMSDRAEEFVEVDYKRAPSAAMNCQSLMAL